VSGSRRTHAVRSRGRLGLAIIVAATVVAIAFGREHALSLESLGRLFVICALAVYADAGRWWARIALGLAVLTACAGLILGAVEAGSGSPWRMLFGLDALLFGAGYLWFLSANRGSAVPPQNPNQ